MSMSGRAVAAAERVRAFVHPERDELPPGDVPVTPRALLHMLAVVRAALHADREVRQVAVHRAEPLHHDADLL